MAAEMKLRQLIRYILAESEKLKGLKTINESESVNNYIEKEEETDTEILTDNSTPKELGDPLSDVELNQRANELGSDGDNAPTVAVKPGEKHSGSDYHSGQAKPVFSDKTKMAKKSGND